MRWLYCEFYRGAPARWLRVAHERGDFAMEPGAFRSDPRHDVSVGRHVPPSSARVADFMGYFASKHRFEGLGTSSRIVAMAAAHHRLNYIHPFVDGNGRVSRLMSHAMAHAAGIGAWALVDLRSRVRRVILGARVQNGVVSIASGHPCLRDVTPAPSRSSPRSSRRRHRG